MVKIIFNDRFFLVCDELKYRITISKIQFKLRNFNHTKTEMNLIEKYRIQNKKFINIVGRKHQSKFFIIPEISMKNGIWLNNNFG